MPRALKSSVSCKFRWHAHNDKYGPTTRVSKTRRDHRSPITSLGPNHLDPTRISWKGQSTWISRTVCSRLRVEVVLGSGTCPGPTRISWKGRPTRISGAVCSLWRGQGARFQTQPGSPGRVDPPGFPGWSARFCERRGRGSNTQPGSPGRVDPPGFPGRSARFGERGRRGCEPNQDLLEGSTHLDFRGGLYALTSAGGAVTNPTRISWEG